ncbi:MAG: hypothetical protein ACM35E_01430 [Deltaproteobacteria bacterium]
MKPTKLVVSLILAIALLPNWPTKASAAAAKQVQRGGKAADHMSERGSANTNAQWSADPEKGWVRAEKRHELHEQSDTRRESNLKFEKAKRKVKND